MTEDVIYLSNIEAGHTALRYLLEETDIEIREVVSLDRGRAEEYNVSNYQPFDELAERHSVDLYYPESYALDSAADVAHFEELDADLLVVNGWQRLIPEGVIQAFPREAIGTHGSAMGLPKGRGRSPLNWSLIEDHKRFLVSVITLEPGADKGAILTTEKFDINRYDTIRTLYHKVAIVIREMLVEVVPQLLDGTETRREQTGQETYYPKRTSEDGGINWQNTTADIYNLVRGVTRPYPGAFTGQDGARIIVWEGQPFSYDLAINASPGNIIEVFEPTNEFVVATADGTFLVQSWEADEWRPERGMELTSHGSHTRVDRQRHQANLASPEWSAVPELRLDSPRSNSLGNK